MVAPLLLLLYGAECASLCGTARLSVACGATAAAGIAGREAGHLSIRFIYPNHS